MFGTYDGEVNGKPLEKAVTPLAYVLLANPIREAAKETFQYFAEQGVEVKVISGDNPVTVSKVARQAGIKNADKYEDASEAGICPDPEGSRPYSGNDGRRRQ